LGPEILSFVAVTLAAFAAATLTMYSGFGLGTVLLPVFALFLPIEAAVLATALVHGANNVFKVSLLGKNADRLVVLRFGIPAVVGAVLGALALGWFAQSGMNVDIDVNEETVAEITPIKFVIGLLMIAFALFELLPRFRQMAFDRRYLALGGALSGFFGGLSGHQGALRSAFLAKCGLDAHTFVGSNAVIGFLVDMTRITVYLGLFAAAGAGMGDFNAWPLVLAGSLAAFCGVLLGKRFLHKTTMGGIQILVGILLFAVGLALITGLL